ncbi:hypothetical protein HN51_053783 [Arachis hypogaea]|uniref:protein PELOTA 1-like n=1 Tax=Arachis ipaensis TaxID=130454 RepID=UPI0007AEE984|nr:protein PELOTA 1-like [Arachis ipaensis]XP_025674436.1 protein PELOTA 1-like [Arachis hypogaea]
MKLKEKEFAVNQMGRVIIIPEESDDLWILYNIINPGDYVTSDTSRKVHHQLHDGKNTTASRVRLSVHLKVTGRDFDKDSSTLRVTGRNLEPNGYVAVGSFHTLTLECNKPFELHKKIWKHDVVEALQERENHEVCPDAELAVTLFQQDHAEIYLIGKGVTAMVSKVETSSSGTAGRKSSSSSPSSNTKNVFFREVFSAFIKHVDLNKVKNTVIASEDLKKDKFRRFMISEAKRMKMRSVEENIGRIVVAAGGGCNGDLKDLLGESTVMDLMKDSKVGLQIRALRKVWDMVSSDSDRACYGLKSVENAQEMGAIETLLISDELYRNDEVATRKRYDCLVKAVKNSGGDALVYSSMHVLAEQLQQLTGVAAILRFPLPAFDDDAY